MLYPIIIYYNFSPRCKSINAFCESYDPETLEERFFFVKSVLPFWQHKLLKIESACLIKIIKNTLDFKDTDTDTVKDRDKDKDTQIT